MRTVSDPPAWASTTQAQARRLLNQAHAGRCSAPVPVPLFCNRRRQSSLLYCSCARPRWPVRYASRHAVARARATPSAMSLSPCRGTSRARGRRRRRPFWHAGGETAVACRRASIRESVGAWERGSVRRRLRQGVGAAGPSSPCCAALLRCSLCPARPATALPGAPWAALGHVPCPSPLPCLPCPARPCPPPPLPAWRPGKRGGHSEPRH